MHPSGTDMPTPDFFPIDIWSFGLESTITQFPISIEKHKPGSWNAEKCCLVQYFIFEFLPILLEFE
jgi:hypothetical protein